MQALEWDNEAGLGGPRQGDDGTFAGAAGFDTAVALSLFTDAPATPAELAKHQREQRGWWADADQVRDKRRAVMGSKIWLVFPGKLTAETLRKVEGYAADALAWMVERRIAQKIEITAGAKAGALLLEVTITRGASAPIYKKTWEVTLAP